LTSRTRIRGACLVLIVATALGLAAGCASDGKDAGSKKAKAIVPYHGLDPLEVIDAFSAEHPVNKRDPYWKRSVPRPPPTVSFDPNKTYYWFITTSEGVIKIELKPKWAPRHVTSTIYLTRLGFYNGLGFHRIIPKFMAQGGDPAGDGSGDPGFRYAGEFHKKAKHDERGVVSMANAGPRTDGSQFFILFSEQPSLDGKHTVFGQVVEGKGTLRNMETLGTQDGKPRKAVVIQRAEIWVE